MASPKLRERTEGKFGSKIGNILTLGIVHQGIAFSLELLKGKCVF
ncbi:MAG: hypothetical protein QNJ55_26820 [Xenococcus sp. MO_188.B8]|nr:hypothetical protein [Xenococcus sp. MO_188.B8]